MATLLKFLFDTLFTQVIEQHEQLYSINFYYTVERGPRVYSYISYIGMFLQTGIIFRVLCLEQGIQFYIFVSSAPGGVLIRNLGRGIQPTQRNPDPVQDTQT